jgi:hypothetical protein
MVAPQGRPSLEDKGLDLGAKLDEAESAQTTGQTAPDKDRCPPPRHSASLMIVWLSL